MNSISNFFRLTAFFPLLLLLSGCLEYSITTQVMPDGRILRTVLVKGDSTDIFNGSFPVPADPTWQISRRMEPRDNKEIGDIDEGKIFVYEARKEFMDFQHLNDEFFTDSTFNDHIAIHVNLEKRFSWFYIHYHYMETYGRLFPFTSVPVKDYLDETELKIFQADEKDIYYSRDKDRILLVEDTLNLPTLNREDSLRFKALRDTIEQKFESWQRINIYNEFFQVVSNALARLGRANDTLSARDDFYAYLDKEKTFETGIENDNAFLEAASAYFKVSSSQLQASNEDGFADFKRKFRVAAYSLETYTNVVLMPGMITGSNAGKVDMNKASWTFKIENFYASDYTMTVESRVVNKWFIMANAVLLLAAITLVLIRLFRK